MVNGDQLRLIALIDVTTGNNFLHWLGCLVFAQ